MPRITIAGTVIDFPSSGTSPNWAPAMVQFAELVSDALSAVVGSFDVPPQRFNIDAYNPGSNVDIPNLTFPTTTVQGAFIRYAVFRQTSTTTATETGEIMINWNPSNPPGNIWEINVSRVGDSQTTFNITDTGQLQFSTTTLGGLNHTGTLYYLAQAVLQ